MIHTNAEGLAEATTTTEKPDVVSTVLNLLQGKTAVKTQSQANIEVSQATRTTALVLGGMALVGIAIFAFRPARSGKTKRRRSRRRR